MLDPGRPQRCLLLDSASLYFRAFFGVPEVIGPSGVPTNAVRGLLDMIASLVERGRPTHLVACWDNDWRPAFRVEAIPSYKAHRLSDDGGEEVDDRLGVQVPIIIEALDGARHRPGRRRRLRGRRRHRHLHGAQPRRHARRHRHRRPRPLPARRRRRGDPGALHGARGCPLPRPRRPGLPRREVCRPHRRRVRRHGRAAWGHERRAAGRPRDRREDGGASSSRPTARSPRSGRPSPTATRRSRAPSGHGSRRRATTSTWPRSSSRSPRTPRSPTSTSACPRSVADPRLMSRLALEHGLTSSFDRDRQRPRARVVGPARRAAEQGRRSRRRPGSRVSERAALERLAVRLGLLRRWLRAHRRRWLVCVSDGAQ